MPDEAKDGEPSDREGDHIGEFSFQRVRSHFFCVVQKKYKTGSKKITQKNILNEAKYNEVIF